MKNLLKRSLPVMLVIAVLAMCGTVTSCTGSRPGTSKSDNNMYVRHQTNKGSKVKSNIKVRGTNKSNSHTTRSY